MIKDTIFSTPRFIDLCRKDMIENWRSNVLRMVLMYGVMALVLVWNGYFQYRHGVNGNYDPAWDFVLTLFMWGLFGFGCLSASFTMEKMKSKTSRLSVLMTPATPFEKFFSRWFVSTIVFLIAFLIAYKLADYTRVLVYTLKYPEIEQIACTPFSRLLGLGDEVTGYCLFSSTRNLIQAVTSYGFVQSFFVLGSSIWPKNAFLKTFAAGIVIVLVYVLVMTGAANLLWDRNQGASLIKPSQEMLLDIISLLAVIMTLVNWTLAYFRFKESEIINRM